MVASPADDWPTTVAHAFGTLQALPGPTAVWLLAAVAAYAGTAWALTRRDAVTQTPPSKGPTPGGRTPATAGEPERVDGGGAVTRTRRPGGPLGGALRLAAAVSLAGLLLLALTGDTRPDRSPLPRTLLVLLVGGVVPLSLVFGPFYRVVNPLRPLATGVRRAAGLSARPLSPRVGRWPAAALTLVALLAAQQALDAPAAVAVGLLVYVGAQTALGVVFGGAWFAAGDVLEVLSDVVGAAAILGPRPDAAGRARGWGPRDAVLAVSRSPVPPATVAVVAVVVGSTWTESIGDVVAFTDPVTAAAATLAACAVAAGLLHLGAVRDWLVPAVLPLAGAYGLQLVTVPLLLDGQIGLAQLSDPLGRGAAPPARVAAGAQLPVPDLVVGAVILVVFVGLHLLALAVAHRAALLRFDLRGARAVQFPLRVVLLTSLLIGLWLPSLGDEEFAAPAPVPGVAAATASSPSGSAPPVLGVMAGN